MKVDDINQCLIRNFLKNLSKACDRYTFHYDPEPVAIEDLQCPKEDNMKVKKLKEE